MTARTTVHGLQVATELHQFIEQKVLPGARKFKELGVHSAEELESVEPLRLVVRPVTKPELTESQPSASPERESRARPV